MHAEKRSIFSFRQILDFLNALTSSLFQKLARSHPRENIEIKWGVRGEVFIFLVSLP
jgi:hypothetical protein